MNKIIPKLNTIIFSIVLISLLLTVSCVNKKFEKTNYYAVVMVNDATFVEYWFPSRGELEIFVDQMPKFQRITSYDPVEDYLMFKRTSGRGVYKVRLNAAPPFAELPDGQVIAVYDLSRR